jgi:hypothetical protein
MRFGLPIFLTLMLSACSTSPDTALLEHRLAVQEKTRPTTKVIKCNCPAYNPETGELDFSEKQFTLSKGEVGEFSVDFETIIEAQPSFRLAVSDYAEKVSNSASFEERDSGMYCWTGTCGPTSEYFIHDLKDVRKTWVFLSAFHKSYAHKCTFAVDPDVWTTETCPEPSSDFLSNLRSVG